MESLVLVLIGTVAAATVVAATAVTLAVRESRAWRRMIREAVEPPRSREYRPGRVGSSN